MGGHYIFDDDQETPNTIRFEGLSEHGAQGHKTFLGIEPQPGPAPSSTDRGESDLNASIAEGMPSVTLIHLANISYRRGRTLWCTAIPIAWLLWLPLAAQVRFKQEPGRILVDIDGKPYTTFYLAPGGNKPYVYPLSTATGLTVTRHFPMEEFPGETKDHPHQRGLFFAHGEINGYNFWATEPHMNNPKKGRMQLLEVVDAKGGAKSGTVRALFEGQDPGGKGIMQETRTLTFFSDSKLRTIDYEVEIDPLEKLTFGDTKEGTFGIRLATSMTEDKGQGRMVNAEGGEMEKQVWGRRSPWVDYDGPVEGQTVGVAIFDHPANPRYTTYWHSRAYGLFAANIFGIRDFTGDKSKDGSMTIEPGHPLRFRYRVVIHTGDVREAHIADLYKQYTSGK